MIPFAKYCARIQERVEQAYRISVVTRDIPAPLLGDLDGLEIHIDPKVTPEQRLFLVAHLFGHTVQWNVHAGAFEIGKLFQPPVEEELLATIMEYEQEAASYSLSVFHQIEIYNADQWLSDYSACDLAYLRHFYRTGRRRRLQASGEAMAAASSPSPFRPLRPRSGCSARMAW